MSKIYLALLFFSLSLLGAPYAGSPAIEELVIHETKDNAASRRNSELIPIQHYEIPLRLLDYNIVDRLPKKAKDALFFYKNGELHVRWMKNPEDTVWHKQIETFLEKNKISPKPNTYFNGYQTASRSYIVVDPVSDYSFSLKVSTNLTGGNWTDKKQTWADAKDVRVVTDAFMKASELYRPKHIVFLDEPAAFGVQEIDQGMIVRMLGELNNEKTKYHYVPGFSIVHDEEGARIAKLNGSDNPAEFWNNHYNIPLAKALAELFVMTGFTYDSPHSQNFMVETDEKFKPTGRIVLKDLGDVYLLEDFYSAKNDLSVPRNFEEDNVIKGEVNMGVGLLHGNEPPSWLSEPKYIHWSRNFYYVFENELSRMTGVPLQELRATRGRYNQFSYASKTYKITESWKPFWQSIRENNGYVERSAPKETHCANLFN